MTNAPVCQVCGTALDLASAITCERCETPHHRDCWEYWGRCSTYACTGLVHTGVARIAPLEELTLDGDAAPAPSDRFLEPTVTKRLMYYTPRGGTFNVTYGQVACEIPAERVPLAFEIPGAPLGLVSPEVTAGLFRPFAGLRRWRRRGETAWLVRDTDGTVNVEVTAGARTVRPIYFGWLLLKPPARIDLVRTWETAADRDGLLALMCRLALVFPPSSPEREESVMDISPVVLMPRSGEPREAFLRQIVRMRDVGRQMGAMLGLDYREAFASTSSASTGGPGAPS